MIKSLKLFHCDNGSGFKSDVTKLLQKQNVDILKTRTKYKHTHTALVEDFNRKSPKLLFKPMHAEEF